MSKNIYAVGAAVYGVTILAIADERYTVRYAACGHITEGLVKTSLRTTRCKVCGQKARGAARVGKPNVNRNLSSRLVGTTVGTYRVLSLSPERQKRNVTGTRTEALLLCECKVCKTQTTIPVRKLQDLCAACKDIAKAKAEQFARQNRRSFTDSETEQIVDWIRIGVNNVLRRRDGCRPCDTLSYTPAEDCLSSAYEALLMKDLSGKDIAEVCHIAYGVGRNKALSTFDKPQVRFVQPFANSNGEFVDPLDYVESSEPDYASFSEYTASEGDLFALRKYMDTLPEADRVLLLRERSDLNLLEHRRYDELLATARSAL